MTKSEIRKLQSISAFWNANRLAHDKKYGYPHHPHIEHAKLPPRSIP